MTKNATEFVSPLTFETLSKKKVIVEMFDEKEIEGIVSHIYYAQEYDGIIVAPATANIIAKVNSGIAGNNIKITSETAINIIQGIEALIIFSRGSPVTFSAAYKQTPTGGVISPNERVITKNTTKNNGVTPTAWTAGNKIGTKINIAAVASINIPTTIKKA